MAQKTYAVSFSGALVSTDFYADVISLSIEEGGDDASMLHLQLALRKKDDGSWNYLYDDRFAPFTPIAVSIGFTAGGGIAGALGALGSLAGGPGNDGLDPVFTGYVTDVVARFDSHPSQAVLEISASDTSSLFDAEEKIALWPNLSDSEIVRKIATGYGLDVQADSTSTVHQEETTTVVQRGTDLQFARTLARRNGLEFFFQTDKRTGTVVAHFQKPALQGTPQRDLAIQFGEDSNLRSFVTRLIAQRPLNVKTAQIDISDASANEAQVGDSSLDTLGKTDLNALVGGPLDTLLTPKDATAEMLVLGTPSADPGELRTIVQAVRDQADWFIEAQGEINSEAYQAVLRPHRLVLVKGAGTPYSGKYYVSRVSHRIAADGTYTQTFEARRNARDLDGSEKFGGGTLALALPLP